MKRDIRSIQDLSAAEIREVFALAIDLKAKVKRREPHPLLAGRVLAMIFEKPSLRTRVTFETGMVQLGGHAIYLQPSDIGLGKRESVYDVATCLSRWVDLVMARTFAQKTVDDLAAFGTVPVINGLSDLEHPCQVLADCLTLRERWGELAGRRIAWVGDGNNVCHSLILLCARLGVHLTVGSPEGYEPKGVILEATQRDAVETGSQIRIVRDPVEAVKGADAVFTDTWASMGQENEAEARKAIFEPYQLNRTLLAKANPGALVLHCLPAHRGEEITDEVIDGPQSVVYDEAENRLHAQKALMVCLVRWSGM
ncbi:MAG: ornithine carbamoyltransferase [Candidatus Sumerlaeia bacterium]|nr:ornithine carbamoyltransferase [Candidatus Sumerlaeia bacterium]